MFIFATKWQKSDLKMVLKFRLKNVFSFRDEITLDLQAAKIQAEKGKALSFLC